jgi:hypothetical protein
MNSFRLKMVLKWRMNSFKFRDWIYKIRFRIYNMGRKKMSLHLSDFMSKLYSFHSEFVKTFHRPPDVFVVRNKAATLYKSFLKESENNRSYYERLFNIKLHAHKQPFVIIPLNEPSIGKASITAIKFGTNISYIQDDTVPVNGMQSVTIVVNERCNDDITVDFNPLI